MTASVTVSRAFASLAQASIGLILACVAGGKRFWTSFRNRRAVVGMTEYDERMLKDIGLSRSDVLGALAAPYSEDPSTILSRRFETREASQAANGGCSRQDKVSPNWSRPAPEGR